MLKGIPGSVTLLEDKREDEQEDEQKDEQDDEHLRSQTISIECLRPDDIQ